MLLARFGEHNLFSCRPRCYSHTAIGLTSRDGKNAELGILDKKQR